MASSQGFGKIAVFLLLISGFVLILPAVSDEYKIEISPTTVMPDQEVHVRLNEIPQDKIINMTLNTTVDTTPGEEMNYHIWNFTFPYESGYSTFKVDMYNLEPGTPATASVIREDGTEASKTGNVSEEGRFNASILHDLNKGMYNVTFIGIPTSDKLEANIDFGGKTLVLANPTESVATVDSSFTPSGFSNGEVEFNVFIDYKLVKTETIKVAS